MSFTGYSVSVSPTLPEVTGAVINAPSAKLVKYDTNGNVVLSNTAGEAIAGIIVTGDVGDTLPMGASVTIAITAITPALASGVIAKGAFVSSNGDGSIKTAVTDEAIVGQALEAATAAGDLIRVQILKGGTAV